MKGTIETPKISKIVASLINHLFMDVILSLEKSNTNEVIFGKQMEIRRCMKEIQKFILTNAYGIYHVEVLDSVKRDLEDPLLVITFKNFINMIPNIIPLEYHIIIDETYTNFEVYQSSPSGILIKLSV